MQTDTDRLHFWESSVQNLAAEVRTRRERLHADNSMCLQVEASLLELSQENEATERLIKQTTRLIQEKRVSLDKKHELLARQQREYEEQRLMHQEVQDSASQAVEEGWRALEDETKLLEATHQQEVARLKRLRRELEDREAMMREKLRGLAEKEQVASSRLRKVQMREQMLCDINRAVIDRMMTELREREALLLSSQE
jgi:hypothetical protein